MDSSWRKTGLELQVLLLDQRAKAELAGDTDLVDQLREQFWQITTQMRGVDRDDAQQVRAIVDDWQRRIAVASGSSVPKPRETAERQQSTKP